jgi:acyl carrier protein
VTVSTTLDDFIELVSDQLGLPLAAGDADTPLSDLPGWDSLYLLRLLVVLERHAGRPLSFPDLLAAPDLAGIYRLAVAP